MAKSAGDYSATCELCGAQVFDDSRLCPKCRVPTAQGAGRAAPAAMRGQGGPTSADQNAKLMMVGGVVVAIVGLLSFANGLRLGAKSEAYVNDGTAGRWLWIGVIAFFGGTACAGWAKLAAWLKR